MIDKRIKKLEKVIDRKPIVEKVYQEIKKCILEGVFAPGELLPEDQLTAATGASRTPIREALMRLQGDDLVLITPRKGARVVNIGIDEINDLSEAREAFEVFFFDRAIENIPRENFKRFRKDILKAKAEIETLEANSEHIYQKRVDYLKIDFAFHRCMIEASGNRIWLKYYDGILDRAKLYSHLTVKINPLFFEQSANEHIAILDAILAGDFTEAKLLVRQHARGFKDRLTATLGAQLSIRS